jgi:gliding motility-associated-like protein
MHKIAYLKLLFFWLLFLLADLQDLSAQLPAPILPAACPTNIDFETGGFLNWKTYMGSVSAQFGNNVISLFESQPTPDHHVMYSRAANGSEVDPFGNFPVVCPNGSGYSVRLGNARGGTEADGLSYEFTIPANRNEYSLTYYYAVVFEGPNHESYQQPRLEIEVNNLTDQKSIDCSSFTFISYGTGLPGFEISPIQVSDNAIILYKAWTPVTINLNGNAGKTIRIFFKTSDCTFVRHFGYAYVDVNSECNGEFPGASFCPNDEFVKVTAPFGFEKYRWFMSDFSSVLSESSELVLQPAPATGSVVAVEVTPFPGFGCKDTLYTRLIDTLTVSANAGTDKVYCGVTPVIIGEPPKTGRTYSWSPATGLSATNSSNPFASPSVNTSYVVTVTSNGGGCIDYDTVMVMANLPDTSLLVIGKPEFCSTSRDSAVLQCSGNNVSIQWYRNGLFISGAADDRYRVTESGSYYAIVKSSSGCELKTRSIEVAIEQPTPGVRYPIQYVLLDKEITLAARNFGAEFQWLPAESLSSYTIRTPVFYGNQISDYDYNIRIQSPNGCLTIDSQLVKVVRKVDVFIPDAFTPNNDRLNDKISPVSSGIESINYFRIYNRYGQELFAWTPDIPAWDGTFKSIPQQPGTYAWQFSGLGVDGQTYVFKGLLVLIR